MPFSPELIVDHAIARKYFNPGKMLEEKKSQRTAVWSAYIIQHKHGIL